MLGSTGLSVGIVGGEYVGDGISFEGVGVGHSSSGVEVEGAEMERNRVFRLSTSDRTLSSFLEICCISEESELFGVAEYKLRNVFKTSIWIKDSRELVEEIGVDIAGFEKLGEEGAEDCVGGESEVVGNSFSYASLILFPSKSLFLAARISFVSCDSFNCNSVCFSFVLIIPSSTFICSCLKDVGVVGRLDFFFTFTFLHFSKLSLLYVDGGLNGSARGFISG